MVNGGESDNNYNVYLLLGSCTVFLFILSPISLMYLADINLAILIIVLGIFLLIGFLTMVLRVFNGELKESADNVDVGKIKFSKSLSKPIKSRGDSNFNVKFTKSVKNDNMEEGLYSLNMPSKKFNKYRKY